VHLKLGNENDVWDVAAADACRMHENGQCLDHATMNLPKIHLPIDQAFQRGLISFPVENAACELAFDSVS
jgi:hypothetical protein